MTDVALRFYLSLMVASAFSSCGAAETNFGASLAPPSVATALSAGRRLRFRFLLRFAVGSPDASPPDGCCALAECVGPTLSPGSGSGAAIGGAPGDRAGAGPRC